MSGWNMELIQLAFSKSTNQLRKYGIVKFLRFFWIFFKLLFRCISGKFDFTYFTIVPTMPGFIRDIFFVFILKLFRITPVYHMHLMGIPKNSRRKIIRKLYQWTFSNAVVIHLSEDVYLSEFGELKLRNHRVFIQPNGIPEEYQLAGDRSTSRLSILHISHLYRFKGLTVLLDVFSQLVHEGYDLVLDIIGDVAHQDVFKEMMEFEKQPELRGRIIWHGLKTGKGKHEIISRADIMVLPTMNDTFPITILEAMQHGLPVIASRRGAIPEMIDDGQSGYLIEPGNTIQLKEKLLMLIDSNTRREQFGNASYQVYRKNYTDQHFFSGLDRIFNSLQ